MISPYDRGSLAARNNARKTLSKVKAVSPIEVLGKDVLKALAVDLNHYRKDGYKPVSPCRLALKLRPIVQFAREPVAENYNANRASNHRDAQPSANDIILNSSSAENAKKKLKKALREIEKLEKTLVDPAIKAFTNFDDAALGRLKRQLGTEIETIGPSIFTKRGHPVVAEIIKHLHRLVFELTGSWWRTWSSEDDPDLSIIDWLQRASTPMFKDFLEPSDLEKVIRTSIRKSKTLEVRAETLKMRRLLARCCFQTEPISISSNETKLGVVQWTRKHTRLFRARYHVKQRRQTSASYCPATKSKRSTASLVAGLNLPPSAAMARP